MSAGIIAGNTFSVTVVGVSITPAEVAANVAPVQTFTVPGVKVGDGITVNPPGQTAGVAINNIRVSAADTVAIQFQNTTAGALTPTAGVHLFTVFRPEGQTYAPRVIV